jgi:hypothetical protein
MLFRYTVGGGGVNLKKVANLWPVPFHSNAIFL